MHDFVRAKRLHGTRIIIAVLAVVAASHLCIADDPAEQDDTRAKYQTVTLRGRVVFMADALQRRFGIKSVDEAKERLLSLESTDGNLYPIVADVRGRSFRRDQRLRKIDLEVLARRYEGSPMIQVIRIFELAKDGKYELDYWCEICAIAMFELKECDCCQGPIELRRRRVKAD